MRRPHRSAHWGAAGWVPLYVVVAGAPLVLAGFEVPPHDGWQTSASVALGFVALSVLGLQSLVSARSTRLSRSVGANTVVRFHRQVTLLAVLAAFGHPALLLVSPQYRGLLDVLHAPPRAQFAWASLVALALLVVTSMWRRVLRLSYPAWHLLHLLLSTVVVGAALVHAFLVDGYTAWLPERALWAAYGVVFFGVVVWVRVVKPTRLSRRPWRVVELWPEPGGALTVGLEPMYRRHDGGRFRFRAGQFAWILTGRGPFTPTYHPFSMSSSALSRRVTFTIKDSGGFTSSVKRLSIGATVYVDGPHGNFTLERHPAPGYVFLAAGVGVTPFLSMLSTLADGLDDRPCWLFLGNRDEHAVIGVRQLALIRSRMNLTVVHCISRPGDGWSGERGRLNVRTLARYLPPNYLDLHYFVCAPGDVALSMSRIVRDGLGVPAGQVHSEQFEMA